MAKLLSRAGHSELLVAAFVSLLILLLLVHVSSIASLGQRPDDRQEALEGELIQGVQRARKGESVLGKVFTHVFEQVCALHVAVVVGVDVDHELGLLAELHQRLERHLPRLVGGGLGKVDAVEEHLELNLHVLPHRVEHVEHDAQRERQDLQVVGPRVLQQVPREIMLDNSNQGRTGRQLPPSRLKYYVHQRQPQHPRLLAPHGV
mmetsp:Transcript_24696/g.80976  ORF Transcript_24696/g.80976 Transcript_24696/m.80976 type:complete len:205 (+) Transcript_24696:184-798(+)